MNPSTLMIYDKKIKQLRWKPKLTNDSLHRSIEMRTVINVNLNKQNYYIFVNLKYVKKLSLMNEFYILYFYNFINNWTLVYFYILL
jgi:hypothetical protein